MKVKKPNAKQLTILREIEAGVDPWAGKVRGQLNGVTHSWASCRRNGWLDKDGAALTPAGRMWLVPDFEDVVSSESGDQTLIVHRMRKNKDGTATLDVGVYFTDKSGQTWEFFGNIEASKQ